MHGAEDPRARLEEGLRVFEAAAGPKHFQRFEASGHESYIISHRDEWVQAVQAFLEDVEGCAKRPGMR